MFAAAAVAAAAALTAISTTTTNPQPNSGLQGKSNLDTSGGPQRPPHYISWHQYAIERRNSLQRRKIEITKRLEKATSANNPNSNSSKSQINTVNLERETTAFKSRLSTQPVNEAGPFKMPPNTTTYVNNVNPSGKTNLDSSEQLKRILNQNSLTGDFKLTTDICNEFLKIHKVYQNDGVSALDELKAVDSTNPTYSNFANLLSSLQASHEAKSGFDLAEVSDALLEYLQLQQSRNNDGQIDYENIESFEEFMTQRLETKRLKRSKSSSSVAVSKFQSVGKHLMDETNRKQEASLNYALSHRWDPKWLKTMRKKMCIPFTFTTLIFLLLSNVSSNWIKLEGK